MSGERSNAAPLVEIRDLVVEYVTRGIHGGRPVRAVAGVSLEIAAGEVYAIVGESGSGKTTLARTLLRLVDATSGEITFGGQEITRVSGEGLRRLRRRMQIVYQDPAGSLDPRMPVSELVAEPLRTHETLRSSKLESRVLELLTDVGLGRQHLSRRPHELSGGQAQRVAIARALALRPELVVLDEPTSALDVSVQAQILNLLGDLRSAHGLTYLLISHDLGVVRHLADRVGVMYLGRLVEESPAESLFADPGHPYTEALLRSAIEPGRRDGADDGAARAPIGDIPSPLDPPTGCRFHPRCWLREQLEHPAVCASDEPVLKPLSDGGERRAACHFADHLHPSSESRRAS